MILIRATISLDSRRCRCVAFWSPATYQLVRRPAMRLVVNDENPYLNFYQVWQCIRDQIGPPAAAT